MPGMDLELLSGLAQMDDDSMEGALMGALMGSAPSTFNMLSGHDSFNYLGNDDDDDPQQAMLGAIAGYNPELAMMMGWNPFSAIAKGAKWAGKKALSPLAMLARGAGVLPRRSPPQLSPMARPTPLAAVQPQMPGVPDRGGRVQPLGFELGAFTAAGPAVVTVRARPQRPVRGGRLVGDFSRTGLTATGLLTLVQLVVATDGQLLSGDPISFAALSPNAFGVGVNLSPAAVGNEIFATVAISALPAGADRVDFNLTLFGLTVG